MLLLPGLGGLNLLDLCDLLLGCDSLTCCSASLGGLLENQGDPLCFATLEGATQNETHYGIQQDWPVIQLLKLSDHMQTIKQFQPSPIACRAAVRSTPSGVLVVSEAVELTCVWACMAG